MKPRIHYLMLLFLVVLPATSGRCYSQSITSITESDIHAMLIAMDRAARKGDVDAVIARFAPGIKIKMSVLNKGSDREQEATLTKEEYASNARQNMRRKLSYQNERKNTRIKIYDEQTAMVTADIYETFKFPEGTARAASSAVLYVSVREGKLVITALEIRMRFY